MVGGDEPRPMGEDAVHVAQPLQLGRRMLHTFQPLLITVLQQELSWMNVDQVWTVMARGRLTFHSIHT